jgi:WD40 repeat protein
MGKFRIYQINIICIAIVILLSIVKTGFAEDDERSFGYPIVILQQDETYYVNPIISPNGKFLSATALKLDMKRYEEGYLPEYATSAVSYEFWNLTSLQTHQEFIYPDVTDSTVVTENPFGVPAAFSSDNQFLALRSNSGFQVFALPNFDVYKTSYTLKTSSNSYDSLVFSKDNQLLAALDETSIVVWDMAQNIIKGYPHPAISERSQIIALEYGWLVSISDPTSSLAFIVCSWLLENCNLYEFLPETTHVTASPDSTFVFTRAYNANKDEQELGLWQLRDERVYQLTNIDVPADFEPFTAIHSFLSNNHILFNLGVDWEIRSFPDLSLVYPIPGPTLTPVWLDTEHIITVDQLNRQILRIYRVGENQPIDEINIDDFPHLSGFRIQWVKINAEQNSLLVYTGWTIIIIPII